MDNIYFKIFLGIMTAAILWSVIVIIRVTITISRMLRGGKK